MQLKFETMKQITISQCDKANYEFKRIGERPALLRLTRLWNWLDCQDNSEYGWSIMLGLCPYAFHNRYNPNSLKFTYPNWNCSYGNSATIVSAHNRHEARWIASGFLLPLEKIDATRIE